MKPLQLVYVDDIDHLDSKEGKESKEIKEDKSGKQKLRINLEAVKVLKRFDLTGRKTEIISVVSEARSGKSTLLNFILASLGVPVNRSTGCCFEARVDEKTVTKGMWVWPVPLPLLNGNQLLLIDTQGTGLGDDSINTQIVSLAFTISSLVIINIDGTLNDEHKTLLTVVKNFISKVDSGGATTIERSNFFPTLLIRSKDYRSLDFQADFSSSITTPGLLPGGLTNPLVTSALDEKLNRDLSGLAEFADPVLVAAQRNICATFAHRHWVFTHPPTAADDLLLDSGVLPSRMPGTLDLKGMKTASAFMESMWSLVDRILSLSKPKKFCSTIFRNLSRPSTLAPTPLTVCGFTFPRSSTPSVRSRWKKFVWRRWRCTKVIGGNLRFP